MADARETMLPDLIARIAKGDRHAFDALYQATSARLNAVCLSILRDRREAEEALEQTYIAVWKTARDAGRGGLSPTAWLIATARDVALAQASAMTPPAAGDFSRPAQAVRGAYLQGLDLDAFADSAGIPPAAARQRLHEGLGELGADGSPDDLLAADLALGLLTGPDADAARMRASQDADLARRVRVWQERFTGFADDLTPVMAPARARQRIRESLGHGLAPLSVDPLERRPLWRGPGGILTAVLLAAAIGWFVWGA
ncbi:sigma factor [uncultured Paracoccus sp.]|uniref:sigma factor n=1 Tax=uncultured Paracoccus sp. TaxID=189685 RepID=UPI0025F283FC|nr:sigma factor [uncultured Paracoccus sp.]